MELTVDKGVTQRSLEPVDRAIAGRQRKLCISLGLIKAGARQEPEDEFIFQQFIFAADIEGTSQHGCTFLLTLFAEMNQGFEIIGHRIELIAQAGFIGSRLIDHQIESVKVEVAVGHAMHPFSPTDKTKVEQCSRKGDFICQPIRSTQIDTRTVAGYARTINLETVDIGVAFVV